MDETIIIYTKYYSEAVIEIIDQYDLNIQLMCFSSYEDVLKYVTITPNLRGIIFLEHKPTGKIKKAYKEILTVADEISGASKQPFAVSIIANNDNPRKAVYDIKTNNINVYFTKFTFFNTDLLRFEGIATVIANTIGVANQSILLELSKEESTTKGSAHLGKIEFINHCINIATCDSDRLDEFGDALKRYPKLVELIQLRTTKELDNLILEKAENLFRIMALKCIERRKEDEKKIRVIN